jgi:hypothetical protein
MPPVLVLDIFYITDIKSCQIFVYVFIFRVRCPNRYNSSTSTVAHNISIVHGARYQLFRVSPAVALCP